MPNDPLLQPYQLKHLTLRNRIMTTSHEPAYPEDGMPKERYRAYHVERARGGVALAMTAGSAVVSRDSPPTFNQVIMYRDEVVPWLRKLEVQECKKVSSIKGLEALTKLGVLDPNHPEARKYLNAEIRNWDGLQTGWQRAAPALC